MRDLLVATRSTDKMVEIRHILAHVPHLRVLDLEDADVPYDAVEEDLEPHATFRKNARSKADYFHGLTGMRTVADDSGLEVDVLGGAPGVLSKRFAPGDLVGRARDEANNDHLLRLLEGRAPEQRTARYVCVAVLVGGAGDPIIARGEASGIILDHRRGRSGFGYDPLFFDTTLGKTFAEISREEKNRRSHRGRAFRALADALAKRGRP